MKKSTSFVAYLSGLAKPLLACVSVAVLLGGGKKATAATPVCEYTAKLSEHDKRNIQGRSIVSESGARSVAEILRLDRANYHALKNRDPEDSSDCLFSSLSARQRMAKMLTKGSISNDLVDRILSSEVLVTVAVFKSHLHVSIATPPEASETSRPEGTSPEAPSLLVRCEHSEKATCVRRDRFRALCSEAKGTTSKAFTDLMSRLTKGRENPIVRHENLRSHYLAWQGPEDRCTYTLGFSAMLNRRYQFTSAVVAVTAFVEADGNILAAEMNEILLFPRDIAAQTGALGKD